MKITISKKEWNSLGSVKKTAQIKSIEPTSRSQVTLDQNFTCNYRLDSRTQDLILTVRKPNGAIAYIARTGPEAKAEEIDIIDDYKVMTDKNDLEGLKNFLVRIRVMSSFDKLVRK